MKEPGWKYHSGIQFDKGAERIYLRDDGLWARVYTRRYVNGEWGKGKTTYSWSPDFKRHFDVEPRLRLVKVSAGE